MLKRILSYFKQKKEPKKLKPYYHYYQELLSQNFIQNLIINGDFIDGRNGGLVLGNSHDEGGIIFLFEFPEGFRVFGEIEGYEYIINRDSAEKHRAKLGEINNRKRDLNGYFKEYKMSKSIKVIDARMKNNQYKYLLLDVRGGFAIINKHSTRIHLDEIDFINKN